MLGECRRGCGSRPSAWCRCGRKESQLSQARNRALEAGSSPPEADERPEAWLAASRAERLAPEPTRFGESQAAFGGLGFTNSCAAPRRRYF